ncbi:DUF6462 family protein [[Clostridium] fimetarium]|uniref:Uncharacterized protein n=1 Tax=[Clostridium] fimetarium TaxID=99656 RepID=A0A1I0M022_9FIRM|nr:DUF6462 family protein [[Clostridium] fimetarium]SEV81590.1 hypothetical protein SAMN05421659_10126 [[Clostridium] fimetarium]
MRQRDIRPGANLSEKRLLDIGEVCIYLSLGKNKAVEFAKEIGSEVKIGRRSLYDKTKIDKYLDEQLV